MMISSSGDKEQPEQDLTAHEHVIQPHGHEERMTNGKTDGRKPHPDFQELQASRPDWGDLKWNFTKTVNPSWKLGQGGNDGGESLKKEHVEIDPYQEGRPIHSNSKLLMSGIAPRPTAIVSTISKDGNSTNLAPFSYFQLIGHDPPIFVIGYASGFDHPRDSLRNLADTGECVINIVSEHFIEAASATAISAPYGVSEWSLTGLHPASCTTVKASRVKEAVFSVEGKLLETKEYESRAIPGKKTIVLAIIEGTRFWVREDAINEDRNLIDPAVLKPMSRLGGITYARTTDAIEIPRLQYDDEIRSEEVKILIKPKAGGQ